MNTQNYQQTATGKTFVTHSGTKRTYVYKRGSTTELSSGFKKLFRSDIITVAPTDFDKVFNTVTRRWVNRSSLFKNNGDIRPAYKKSLEVKLRLTSYPTSEWLERVKHLRKGVDILLPFALRFTSGIISNMTKDLSFNNFWHFEQFVENLFDADYRGGSGNTAAMTSQQALVDGFEFAQIEVVALEGGCNHACGGAEENVEKTFKNNRWVLTTFNPVSQRNQCAYRCIENMLNVKLDIHAVRKKFIIKPNVPLSIDLVQQIYNYVNDKREKLLMIIQADFIGEIDLVNMNVMLLEKGHYYVITNARPVSHDDVKCCRGDLAYDYESRPDFSDFVYQGHTKCYRVKPTICAIYYRFNRTTDYHRHLFTTTRESSAARQFLDWLIQQAFEGHHFNVVGHFASIFDAYLTVAAMTMNEQLTTKMQLRGTSLIGLQFHSHLFKCSGCFIIDSLDNMCKAYKIKTRKLTSFKYQGRELSNMQLCMFRPEIDFWEFMGLEQTNPEMWNLYTEYCYSDVESLSEIWKRFVTETDALIKRMDPVVLNKCSTMSCNTIGALAKKILDGLQAKSMDYKFYKKFIDGDEQKYQYIAGGFDEGPGFKNGGISHCNQPGKHLHQIVSYDITSQYSACMMFMHIAVGPSSWYGENAIYNPKLEGFYTIKNLKFNTAPHAFRPIAFKEQGKSLDWIHDWQEKEEVNVTSGMLTYLIKTQGLVGFTIQRALLSKSWMLGEKLFGKYVRPLFKGKQDQDEYKESNAEEYNPCLRAIMKIMLNASSGKLVQESRNYPSLAYVATSETPKLNINGILVKKTFDKTTQNDWVNAGCCLYGFSKELLFEYINALPRGSADVCHVETDSVYMHASDEATFLENMNKKNSVLFSIGSNLGNVKKEYATVGPSYFIGKKNYFLKSFDDNNNLKSVLKIKGIKTSSYNTDGSKIVHVNESFYERQYAGEVISTTINTLKKNLYGETGVRTCQITRRTRTLLELHEYGLDGKINTSIPVVKPIKLLI